jgi:glycosyltransferase involved in cell wall biosynthesis/predicted SAM-dependent methyltransferase/intein/homing endonuclease
MSSHPFTRAYFEGEGYAFYFDFPCHWKTVEVILKRKPESVLDVGGGRGYVVKKLEDAGVRAVCMDISEHCWHARATDSFVLWDATKTPWPFKDKEFDLCVSIAFFEHIPEDKVDVVIREMARVSRRGLHGISFDFPSTDIDKTHVTKKPREWWERKFKEVAPDWPVEILDKEEVEAGPIPIPQGDGLVKLNIGCFINCFHYGWVNIDILDLHEFARKYGYVFRQLDVRSGLPYPDDSVDIILASHFLEHLTREEGEKFLRECFRVLKPGGVIRLAVPDAKLIAQKYLKGEIMEYRHVNVGVENARDPAEALLHLLIAGHQTIYDEESLKGLLEKIGFVRVERMGFNRSRSEAIRRQTFDMYPTLSLYVEAEKPRRVVTARRGKLKIALVSTPFLRTPPDTYGGLERVVADLAEELAKLGHDVTVFAADGSKVPGCKIVEFGPPALRTNVNWLEMERKAYEVYKPYLSEFQIIHDHSWFGFPYLAKMEKPELKIIHTHHGHLNWRTKPPGIDKVNLVAISKWMQRVYASQGWNSKVVYHGINLDLYRFKAEKDNRLVFVGRLDRFKQPHVAIEVAERTGLGLDIVGGSFVQDPAYLEEVKRMCDGEKIRLHLDAPDDVKVRLLQNAKALLFPSKMCIPEGFCVLTEHGIKDIKCVRVGDTVFSHNGEWCEVMEVTSRQYDGDVITITPYLLNLPLTLTPNHRVFSAHRSKTWASRMTPSIVRDQPNSIKINDPDWIACHELNQGDFIVIPVPSSKDIDSLTLSDYLNKNEVVVTDEGLLYTAYFNKLVQKMTKHASNPIRNRIEVTPEFLRLLGYYVAEGSSAGSHIRFNFGKNDAELIADAINTVKKLGLSYRLCRETHRCTPLLINSIILKKVFENWFGVGAKNKRLPKWLLELPPAKLWAFIKGIWLGDGCKRKANGYDYFEYSTASKTLALQLWLILLKVGIIAQLTKKIQGTKAFGRGNPIYRLTITGKYVQVMADALGIKLNGRRRVRTWQMGFFYKNYVYLPIRKIERKPFKGIVYNLEVSKTKSFLCEGLMVHNSEPFGLVAVEAMACGTSVVALRDGAIPEVVEDGVTGYVCDSVEEMVKAVERVGEIEPKACRERVERFFSREIMAGSYLRLYLDVLEGREW